MAPRKLILHLGLAKTGTTILQNTFFAAREALLQSEKLLYPSGGANHWHFQTLVADTPENLIQVRREGGSTRASAKKIAQKFHDGFVAEVERSQPDTIVISSEYFLSMSEDELCRLRDLLLGYCDELLPIGYLRDPWSFATSVTQQMIRDGVFSGSVQVTYHVGIFSLLERFERVFGDSLVLRPYFGMGTQRTDIVADFCTTIGVNPEIVRPFVSTTSNEAIGYIRSALIAELNRVWPQYDENRLFLFSAERDWALQRILDLPAGGSTLQLSRNQADLILQIASDGLDWVERRFLGGQRLFHDFYSEQVFDGPDRPISIDMLSGDEAAIVSRALITALARR